MDDQAPSMASNSLSAASNSLSANEAADSAAEPNWKPLTKLQRRVAGVLVEKSKTTPDVYPMTLNGLRAGSNQKSNRSPKMDLEEHQVENTLYELRALGAVVEFHSGGRVPKFKHELYEWLGVDKAELAVMTELLLRGEQTIGELRARAARMEKSIAGMEQLRPILSSLMDKDLVVPLTPAGRGQVVTHNLYQPEELQRLKVEFCTPADLKPSRHANRPSGTPANEDSVQQGQSSPAASENLINNAELNDPAIIEATQAEVIQAEVIQPLHDSIAQLKANQAEIKAQVDALRQELANVVSQLATFQEFLES